MTAIVAVLQSDRVERGIDLGVFGLGAGSLALALALTLAAAFAGDDRAATEAAPAATVQAV